LTGEELQQIQKLEQQYEAGEGVVQILASKSKSMYGETNRSAIMQVRFEELKRMELKNQTEILKRIAEVAGERF
jgi:hypothetical protein